MNCYKEYAERMTTSQIVRTLQQRDELQECIVELEAELKQSGETSVARVNALIKAENEIKQLEDLRDSAYLALSEVQMFFNNDRIDEVVKAIHRQATGGAE